MGGMEPMPPWVRLRLMSNQGSVMLVLLKAQSSMTTFFAKVTFSNAEQP